MYVVIANGGKQYKVAKNQVIQMEQMKAEAGDSVEFDQVLLLSDGDKVTVGAPILKNVKVKGEVVEHGRGKKIHIIKFRRRKHHMKRMGHRQNYTAVKIVDIETSHK